MHPSPLLERADAVAGAPQDVDATVPAHYGSPLPEQAALVAGLALSALARDVVAVTGPDRRSWLTTLSSQVLTHLAPGDGGVETLLMDAQGHITHALAALDDGQVLWLVTEAGAGPALATAGASAMMDVSDSLLRDCARLAQASGVLIDLDEPAGQPGDSLSRMAAARAALEPVAALAGEQDPASAARTWVLTGGEDHGLLATVALGIVLPQGVSPIGRVRAVEEAGETAGAPGVLVGARPWRGGLGWDHFGA